MFLYKHFIGGAATSEVEDVIRNLNNVLTSRRGSGYFLASFGLSEVGHRTPEEMVVTLTAEIKENVRLYEPRVELVDVDEVYDDDGKRVRLLVSLRLRGAGERLRITVNLADKTFDIQPLKGTAKR